MPAGILTYLHPWRWKMHTSKEHLTEAIRTPAKMMPATKTDSTTFWAPEQEAESARMAATIMYRPRYERLVVTSVNSQKQQPNLD